MNNHHTEEKTMTRVTLHNSFHNTEVSVHVPDWMDDPEIDTVLEMECLKNQERDSRGPYTRKLARIKRELCGMPGCRCTGMVSVHRPTSGYLDAGLCLLIGWVGLLVLVGSYLRMIVAGL